MNQSTAESTFGGPADRGATESLAAIHRKLRWLTVAVFLVALALLFDMAAVFGTIIEFHAGEGLLIGSACGAGAVLGFLLGWLAARAMGS